ncbi:MAG: ferritin-like domain-containing protein [Meiothermus sp.]|nr:ferritin-like domain-containing protein [Meiothermus sp.]
MQNLQELFVTELRDAYDAETQAVDSMPRLMECATNPQLRQALQQHLEQTQRQVERLEQIFEQMGEEPGGEPCEAMRGLVAEAEEIVEMEDEADPDVLDAAIIAAAQKMEHYEIASYGTLSTWATVLGQGKVKEMLGQILSEEKEADQMLSALAEQSINPQAMQGTPGNDTRSPSRSSAR